MSRALSELVLENGKAVAYTVVLLDKPAAPDKAWGIGIAVEDENGYRPVNEYGPYTEERARMVAKNLNTRIGLTDEEVWKIVASSMRGTAIRRQRRPRRSS